MAGTESRGTCIGIIVLIVCAGVIALICSSYADLEYNEIGFVKSKTTGSVDTSKVYESGRKWIGPDKTFKKYTSSAHRVKFTGTSVFVASDKSGVGSKGQGGTVYIDAYLVYFIVPEDLKYLHAKYDVSYKDVMEKTAKSAIKDRAGKFKLNEFIEEREKVEKEIHVAVQTRLGGQCCPVNRFVTVYTSDCIPRSSCNESTKGLYVDVRYFQITALRISKDIEDANLDALVLSEDTAKQDYIQFVKVIEKETERQVDIIKNEAKEVEANATANAQLIEDRSQANYQRILEEARMNGLKRLFTSIGLSDVTHKNTLDYLRTLSDQNNAHLTVGFDQLIMASKDLVP